MKEAIKRFTELGVNVIHLPVSGAFHSQIVAPAIESFREALEKLTFNKPDIPISSNVTGEMYPNTRKEMIALLCDQIASPVEWMKQIKGMYEEHGVRTFIEIGPKYVLTGFTRAILEDKQDVIALASNHPKKGAMQHFNEVLAAFGAYGYPITPPRLDDSIYTEEFRNPQVKFYQSKPIAKQLLERQISQIQFHESPFDVLSNQGLSQIVKEPSFKEYLELQSSAISAFLEAGYKTYKTTIETALKQKKDMDRLELVTEEVGITGISLGLPGRDRNVFDEKNFDAILAGQNFIDPIPQEIREKMVDKNIVRLVKDAVKGAQFQAISDVSEVIKLAAQKGKFNLSEEYGISTEFVEILDITFQLAFAAGIEALRDAGIPLTPMKVKTSVGKEITKGWALPESLRDDTGIVFASAFPAYSNLISTISRYLSDKFTVKNREEMILFFDELIGQIKDGPSKQKVTQWFENNKSQIYSDKQSRFEFSRKFLFEVLSMGHSQFAQFICARGPNTQVNAACSSTTQAISIAEDWLRTGRCKRAIVIAADDVTNEEMLEWIGSGFLAVGAATTKENVEEAALPFDKRRHGMIIGMGAVGIILESETSIRTRGVQPIVDLLGTHIVNSAFHGTRLDRDHISNQMNNFITKIENRYNISREEIAQQMVFVSHETYTPARGGSASAEVDAIRKTFGQSIDKIVIANTKGFTGHAMGAGIEDVVAIKMLEKGIVPPVANWKEMDPELGTLNLSKGGKYDIKYALRFAAGFGSQLTLALFRLHTKDNRFASKAYDSWLASIGGSRKTLEVSHKTLLLNEDEDIIKQPFISPKISDQIPIQVNGEIIQNVVSLISEKTGYPTEMIELDMHLEEDLGIDTVKMAELFGILRTKYNLPREEGLRIQDYFSARKIAEYIAGRLQQSSGALQPVETTQAKSEASVQVQSSSDVPTKEIIDTIISLISEKTGYPVDMIEPKMELEEDLGIDTVKQAEIFGILRGKWNLPREEGIRIQDYSTVEKIAQYISNRISQTSKVSAKGTTETSSEKIEIIPAKRYTIQLVDIPKINTSGIELKDKKFVLVGDSSKYTKEIQTLLEKKKAVVTNFYSLTKITDFNTLIAELPVEPTDGLVFIEPSTNKFQDKNDLARIYFIFCRYLNFNNQPIILAINRNTESFGWGQTKANPEIGSITGLTKALAREFRNSTTKIISSIDPKYVIDELIKGDGSVEVVLDEKGNRKTFIVTEEPISEATSKELPTKDDLILVTGGAQGITYEITKRIAEKYSAKLILFGRSQLPIDIANLAKLSDSELANEKQKMIDQLKKTEERLTPVKIEKEWSKIVKSINVQKAIDTLTALGSEVKYYSLDVTNTSAVKEAINKAESAFKSKITGIVHGAGLEVSKLIKDKELTDFNTVFDVKVRGFDNLLENIQLENLKFLICFSSVAGRFGNAGQVDYAAANDYLSKSCWLLRAKGIPATSICWSAWAEVGMATRGSVMTVLQHAGLTPIQVKDGIEAFINELEFGNSPEVVIAGKLGVLMDSPLPVVSTDCRKYPLIGAVKRNFDGSLLAEREFSLENDLYLNHHRFEGVPFLPGVIGLELFSEMGKLAYPKKIIKEFNDIEFRSAIKFLKDNSRKLISRITYAKDPIVTIESETENPTTKLTTRKLHFQGKIIFGKKPKELVEKLQIPKKKIMSLKEIYQVLPHGPLFQVLQSMNSISEETVAINQLKTGNLFKWEVEELTSQPLAIESGFQAMGLMDIIRDKRMGLPYQIKSLKYNDFTDEPLYIHGIKKGDNDHGSLYDFEIITGNNEVALKAEDYATVKVDMNMDLSEIENLKKNQVKNLFNVSSQDSIEVVDVHKTKEKVSKNGFLEAVLHSDELAQYHTFIVEKRKNEWLAGVYAAKLAVKQLAPELELNSLNITKSTLGKPSIIASNKQSFFISITHSNGFAVAIASKNNNLGIDLEQIQNREKEFVDELLSGKEKELLQKKHEITEELLTKIWTAKEAATKVLGTGLNIDLHDLQLEKLSDRKISLKIDRDKLPKEILKDLLAINSKDNSIDMVATISTYDDYVAATCEYQKTNN
ncbi:MAG: SDR family NAD(P)-dependent oxidoreductase [Candidatus Thorarchaeota archaeon]